jgi:hypothetical protein
MDITITINDYNKTFDGVVYVDSINGNDTNSGLSMDQPVKTFNKLYELVPNNGIIYIENELQLEVSTRHFINKNLLFIGDKSKITNTTGELDIKENIEVYFYNLILENECIIMGEDTTTVRIIDCDCNFYGYSSSGFVANSYVHNSKLYIYNSQLLNEPSSKFGSYAYGTPYAYLYNCSRNYDIIKNTYSGRVSWVVYEYDETEAPIISTDKSINVFKGRVQINSISYNIIDG